MLGRQTYRTGKFTMVHAAVLLAFIGLAHVIGPASKAQDVHLSDAEPVESTQTGIDGAGETFAQARAQTDPVATNTSRRVILRDRMATLVLTLVPVKGAERDCGIDT